MKIIPKSFKDNQEFAGVILDLRSSPGGSLSVALKIADSFLDNEIIVSAQEKDKDANQFYNSSAGDIAQDKPLVILVDGETTSSAEIVAVALKDQSRAKIIGTQTFGKGSRQDLFGLPNGAELGLTTAYFYAPSGKAIDGNGVQPDICTFEMLDRKNLEDILAKPSKDKCPQEVRENKNIDLDIAETIINQQI